MLQWGHDLSAVETVDAAAYEEGQLLLQWGHDLSAVETFRVKWQEIWTGLGFNGATTFQPWKPCPLHYSEAVKRELQWGHDLSAVETMGIGAGK